MPAFPVAGVGEYSLQNLVSLTSGIVEFTAGPLVVAVVGKNAGLGVKSIGPVRINETRNKDQLVEFSGYASSFSETALAIYAE